MASDVELLRRSAGGEEAAFTALSVPVGYAVKVVVNNGVIKKKL